MMKLKGERIELLAHASQVNTNGYAVTTLTGQAGQKPGLPRFFVA